MDVAKEDYILLTFVMYSRNHKVEIKFHTLSGINFGFKSAAEPLKWA